jgi:hypothetical protein
MLIAHRMPKAIPGQDRHRAAHFFVKVKTANVNRLLALSQHAKQRPNQIHA